VFVQREIRLSAKRDPSKFKEYTYNSALYGKIAFKNNTELFNSRYIVLGHSNRLVIFSERGFSLHNYIFLFLCYFQILIFFLSGINCYPFFTPHPRQLD